jgi:hypothetical protein
MGNPEFVDSFIRWGHRFLNLEVVMRRVKPRQLMLHFTLQQFDLVTRQ